MEVTNCTDINGNEITNIRLNNDGTVLAVLEINGIESTSNLSYECCIANDYTFDPTDTKCYWSTSCINGGDYKIILSPEADGGVIFQVDDSLSECKLEVEFDYLLKFNCDDIINNNSSLASIFSPFKIALSVEKEVYDVTKPIPNYSVSVKSEDIINITDIGVFLSGNTNTGILLDGNNCDSLIQNLITYLGPVSSQFITTTSFKSDWVRYKMVITDAEVLNSIANERIKLAIVSDKLFKFSILIDNIKLNQVCTEAIENVTMLDECPSFELKRVIDNKKSWVYNDATENRLFDLSRRETNYSINDDKLGINTKEVDLLINPSNAIENDLFTFISTNPCILLPGSGGTASSSVNIQDLMTSNISDISSNAELLEDLIDVKSRKTISGYPVIELLYYRYSNSLAHCGVSSNALDYESVTSFVDLIGGFWSDLIEQVVPATTIWGSSYRHSDNIYGSNKYDYKKSTLILCDTLNVDAPSPSINSNSSVGVTTIDVTDTGYFGPIEFMPPSPTQNCTGVSIVQINDGSEFIGIVTITGGGTTGGGTSGTTGGGTSGTTNVTSGTTFTINETISNICEINPTNCNIYNKWGDFNPSDFNNLDWDTPNN